MRRPPHRLVVIGTADDGNAPNADVVQALVHHAGHTPEKGPIGRGDFSQDPFTLHE
jgi:hypothetical protein